MLVCVLPNNNSTRDRGCSAHPVFPAPSCFRGRQSDAKLGRIAPRDCGRTSSRCLTIESENHARVARQAGGPASHDQECAERTRKAPRHRAAQPRRRGAVFPFLRRQDAQGRIGRSRLSAQKKAAHRAASFAILATQAWSNSSDLRRATIDEQFNTGDVAGIVRRQKQHGVGDFVRGTETI
jgi:hypothetical protein